VCGFTHCWVLLQLARGPAHGYELVERMAGAEYALDTDPGYLYRTLRGFEEEGLVRSSWDTTGSGPARRMYVLTERGWDHLHAWSVYLRQTRDRLDRFLSDYATLAQGEGGESDVGTPSTRPR
jgi:DNA-binding PadR family transcriptional regulator